MILTAVLGFAAAGCGDVKGGDDDVEPPTAMEITVTVGERTALGEALDAYIVADTDVATCDGAYVTGFKPGETTVTSSDGKTVYNVIVNANELGTTHVYDVRQTSVPLVANGKTDFALVIPEGETDELVTDMAVSEFNELFKEATGITLPVFTDDMVPIRPAGSYVFLGDTRQAEAANVTADLDTYGYSGFRMRTLGKSVYCVGGGSFGTLYTVYEFMKRQFGFCQYAPDEMYIERNVTDCKLLDYNIADIPDFEYRTGGYGDTFYSSASDNYPHRMRLHVISYNFFMSDSQWVHNYFEYIPPDKYKSEHPDWFATDGAQLCLTRDAEGLSDEVVQFMKDKIASDPHLSILSFTQNDTMSWCRCPSCTAMYEEYGTDAASNIKFANIVASKLRPWLKENYPDRKIYFPIFAYNYTENAPAVLNAETGKYEPMDESVVLDDMFTVFYAPILYGFYYDFEHEANTVLDLNMRKWGAITDSMFLWIYQTLFSDYMHPYDGINSIKERYIYAYKHNAKFLFDQGRHNIQNGTDWFQMKSYIESRMMWDVMQNPEDIVTEFIEHYYKDASPAMLKLYKSWKQWLGYACDAYGYTGKIYEPQVYAGFFPETVLNEWLGYIDEAYAAIDPVKESDPQLYEKLYIRICTQSLSARYLKLMLYKNSTTAEGFRAWYLTFKDDCILCNVEKYNEVWTISSSLLESNLLARYPDLHTLYPDLF